MEGCISFNGLRECRQRIRTTELVRSQHTLEITYSSVPGLVISAQPIDQRAGFGVTLPQQPEQVLIFLRMVEALGKRGDVMNHCAEQLEVRRSLARLDRTREIEQAVQHGGERTMLVENDIDRIHPESLRGPDRTKVAPNGRAAR